MQAPELALIALHVDGSKYWFGDEDHCTDTKVYEYKTIDWDVQEAGDATGDTKSWRLWSVGHPQIPRELWLTEEKTARMEGRTMLVYANDHQGEVDCPQSNFHDPVTDQGPGLRIENKSHGFEKLGKDTLILVKLVSGGLNVFGKLCSALKVFHELRIRNCKLLSCVLGQVLAGACQVELLCLHKQNFIGICFGIVDSL